MRSMSVHTCRRGFTLIELLVVIAIILILAAILFPVFGRVLDRARAAACLSNLKQIGIAVRMYADDYDGVAPITRGMVGSATEYQDSWAVRVTPYIKNTQIFQCPGYRWVMQSYQQSWWIGPSKYGLNLNCARNYNDYWGSPGYAPKNLDPKKNIVDVSWVPLVLCWWTGQEASTGGKQTGSFAKGTIKPWQTYNQQGHHNDSLEYVCWLDGHVQTIKTKDLETGPDVVWRPW